MKIWKGIELEGADKGIMTMFVKNVTVRGTEIIKFLRENQDCKRLYLGAGRTDIQDVEEWIELCQYCRDNDIDIIVENSYETIKNIPDDLMGATQVIIRIYNFKLTELSYTDVIKVDTGKDVYTVEMQNMINTNLKTLHGDAFESDVVLFEEE